MIVNSLTPSVVASAAWSYVSRTLTTTVNSIINNSGNILTSIAAGVTFDARPGINTMQLRWSTYATDASSTAQIGVYDGATLQVGHVMPVSQFYENFVVQYSGHGLGVKNNAGAGTVTYAFSRMSQT